MNAFNLCTTLDIDTDTLMDTLGCLDNMKELFGTENHLCLDYSTSNICEPVPSLNPPHTPLRPLFVPLQTTKNVPRQFQKYMASYMGLSWADVLQGRNHTTEDARVIPYAPRLRLVFSLLLEDASRGPAIQSWYLQQALETMEAPALAPLRRILHALAPVHEMELESQIQWYAPLEFAPQAETVNETTVYTASMEEVRVFINSPQWSLASYDTPTTSVALDERTLHFVLFVPHDAHSPLYVRNDTGSLVQQPAWIVPQWGGVVVWNRDSSVRTAPTMTLNELQEPIRLFSQQLAILLGMDLEAELADDQEAWHFAVEGLQWRRTLDMARGVVETLASIDRLVRKISNLGVNAKVRDTFTAALDKLDACKESLQGAESSVPTAMKHASEAYRLASQAFYDPSMLAMLYFPEEHKYAVYFPLFGPLFLPLAMAIVREYKLHKARRRSVEARTL
ncbi:GPI transamidase component [Malassezia nana]|uniref:GPI transamidase component n=1 Tax=Malassezia nana TaxID=180528 RepID=A0AAF0J3Z4_9BASI|nr:GPI transamidase component [Malassezia nana]